jgi:aminoglycoside phosphotransferase family enzyme
LRADRHFAIEDSVPNQHREADQAEVTAFLGDPATHGGAPVQMVETHAAKIFLAGGDAYKLKRALAYPYLDFTSLAERKRVCEREIELNRRTAPEIYLGCVPVTRAADGTLAIGGASPVVEWLVHMRRFDPASTLDRVLEDRGLKPAVIDALAEDIALCTRAQSLRSWETRPIAWRASPRGILRN